MAVSHRRDCLTTGQGSRREHHGPDRNAALETDTAVGSHFQKSPSAELSTPLGAFTLGVRVLLLQEGPSAPRKVKFSSTKQRSHAQYHQLW